MSTDRDQTLLASNTDLVSDKPSGRLPRSESKPRISRRLAFGYGAVSLGIFSSDTFVNTYYLQFLLDTALITAFYAGLIQAGGQIVQVFGGFGVGIWSDKTENPRGRRRPFIIAGSMFFMCLIFSVWVQVPESWPSQWRTAYYFIFVFLYNFVITVVNIPHSALAPDMTSDYDLRMKLSSSRSVFSFLGMLLVVVYAYLVFKFFPETPFAVQLSDWTYVIIAAFPIVATFIGGLVSYGTTTEDPSLLEEEEDVPASSNCIKIGQLSRIPPFVLVVFMYTFAQLVNSVAQSLLPLYVVHVVGFELEYFSLLLIVQMAMMVTTVIVVSKISKKFEKRTFFNAGCFVYAMVAVAYFFIPSAGTTEDWARYMIYPIAGFAGIGQALTFTMPNAMMADVTDYAHLKLHAKSEGLMFSVMETSQSIVQAVAAWVVGYVLDLEGYVSGEKQTEEVKLLIRCLFCFITLGAMVFCWLLSFGYTLNRKKHSELLLKLGAQHNKSRHEMYVVSAVPHIPDVDVLTAPEPEEDTELQASTAL